ncbi:hypothetical protein PPL_11629 [Heterostelium album PN500]|uniref:Uncharacterized protein n=1 Tax=Heterostelium pallidum (strain ATCC 26659 / Pp 5 / PN500) TaxID=670386 RepID=D3BVA3_HETP5|nr:hypothetical protein PPL_11629 [Heterostelium album PN500]EFA74660.1 hypothetical protein PPL_11629 [Heterostelium album PN500]|eukprot:XP_020426794.1 hypothetical protein PPL_11629 [Heterostelium album PN500]
MYDRDNCKSDRSNDSNNDIYEMFFDLLTDFEPPVSEMFILE